jgi:hypothetical protein
LIVSVTEQFVSLDYKRKPPFILIHKIRTLDNPENKVHNKVTNSFAIVIQGRKGVYFIFIYFYFFFYFLEITNTWGIEKILTLTEEDKIVVNILK